MASPNSPGPMAESMRDSALPSSPLRPSGPPSIISSRMTDIASEDGDAYAPTATNKTQTSRQSLQSMSASRPGTGSAGVPTRSPWTQSPPSRRGLPGQRGSIPGLSNLTSPPTSRPQSSASRTHVPSVTSHAFFRPMSSQRLQAQRGGSRPVPVNQQRGSGDFGNSDIPPVPSITSDQTATKPRPSIDDSGPPPPSRGTEMSLPETYVRTTANTSPTQDVHDHRATGSLSSSVQPLQNNPANAKGLSVNTDTTYRNQHLPAPSKSPHSFRSSFLLPSRGGDIAPHSPNRSTHGHEKLSSRATSPNIRQSDATLPAPNKHSPNPQKEKNHHYFPGNTRFWLGGRWQNARDRPVNIATGFLVVLPAVLFFVFSAPWLWHNISPAIPIVFAYIFYICISSFVHASVSDPGVSFLFLTHHLFHLASVLTKLPDPPP
jgi:palmitoyltransferase ZDHHC9/14/18